MRPGRRTVGALALVALFALLIGGCAPGTRARGPTDEHGAACAEVERLAAAGDHKPAVDAFDGLSAGGSVCGAEIAAAIDDSRQVLGEADALVRAGLEARETGDLEAAGASFDAALEVYPRYQWVERLREALEGDSTAVDEMLRRAADLRAAGRVEEALTLIESATVRQAQRPEVAAALASTRLELGDRRLAAAYREQRTGNLRQAVDWTRGAIAAAPGEPVRGRVVDFARRLGLDLFSNGELVEAGSLWRAALDLDPDNELLRQYLEEVETRLRSLGEIQDDDPGESP